MPLPARLTLLLLLAGPAAAGPPAAPDADLGRCQPLAAPTGNVVPVATVQQLVDAVDNASPGDTILVADGTYLLDGAYLRIDVPGVSLRSASGDPAAVVLDGDYVTTEIVQVVASNVTVAELTLREAWDHPVHVMSEGASITGTVLYRLHVVDPGQQAVKVNPAVAGFYADDGLIACSRLELTDAGRAQVRDDCYTGGVDAHQARGWVVRDNEVEGFWCELGLSEHAVHFWRGSRDTVVERNRLRDNARGVGFGLQETGTGRTYPDNPCPGVTGYVDHYGGVVRNNFVSAARAELFASEYGFDCGVCFTQACSASALHNTVFSSAPPFSSIEWRFPHTTGGAVVNNLVSHPMRERDGATATLAGNLETAQAAWFAAASRGELHLRPSATAAVDHAAAWPGTSDDVDGQPRPAGPAADVGADELAAFAKGDLDRDGRPDLLFRHAPTGRNEAWLMNGTTRDARLPLAETPAGLDWSVVGVDDFDADLGNDLLLWNQATGALQFWLMDGASRRAALPLSGAPTLAVNWRPSATGDFDHDGRPDLLWRNLTSQKLVIWLLNGTAKAGNLIPVPDQAVDPNWEVVAALDFDGDGNRDLLWYNWSSGKIVQWLMNAAVQRLAGRFTAPPNAGDANWKVLAGGDYGTGAGGTAGTNDVVWRNATSGRIVVWHLDLSGTRTAGTFTTPDAPGPPATDWTLVGPR